MLTRFTFCLTVVFVPLAIGGGTSAPLRPAEEVPSRDWPQWRGPERNAISTETGLLHEWPTEGQKLLWSSGTVNNDKSVGRGFSSISIAAGRIFTMGDQGK